MTEREGISVSRQCELVGLPRSTFYSRPAAAEPPAFTEDEERVMRIMDEEHARNPSYGARSHMRNLARHGMSLSRRKAAALMAHWASARSRPAPPRAGPPSKTRGSRTCSGARGWAFPTRCGRPTSPTSRWGAATSTCPPSSTGTAATSWDGGCTTRWRPASAAPA